MLLCCIFFDDFGDCHRPNVTTRLALYDVLESVLSINLVWSCFLWSPYEQQSFASLYNAYKISRATMSRPSLLSVSRWCSKWRSSFSPLFILSLRAHTFVRLFHDTGDNTMQEHSTMFSIQQFNRWNSKSGAQEALEVFQRAFAFCILTCPPCYKL